MFTVTVPGTGDRSALSQSRPSFVAVVGVLFVLIGAPFDVRSTLCEVGFGPPVCMVKVTGFGVAMMLPPLPIVRVTWTLTGPRMYLAVRFLYKRHYSNLSCSP